MDVSLTARLCSTLVFIVAAALWPDTCNAFREEGLLAIASVRFCGIQSPSAIAKLRTENLETGIHIYVDTPTNQLSLHRILIR